MYADSEAKSWSGDAEAFRLTCLIRVDLWLNSHLYNL